MPFFKKKDDPVPDEGPVFIDLGSVPISEEDTSTRVRIIPVEGEKDLRSVKKLIQSDTIVLADLSQYSGDFEAMDSALRMVVEPLEGLVRSIGGTVWLIAPRDVVVEAPKR